MDPPAAVVDYDPAWPTLFEEIRSRVEPLVADLDGWVEHVGSTSVPGLAAKPIIDIDVVVRTATQVALAVERLAVIGYIHQGDRGIVGREAFQPLQELLTTISTWWSKVVSPIVTTSTYVTICAGIPMRHSDTLVGSARSLTSWGTIAMLT